MQDAKDAQARTVLRTEIETLETQYRTLRSVTSGAVNDDLKAIMTLQAFRDTLNGLSGYILALYTLRGQKTKITWESLLANIDNALENLRSARRPNPKTAIDLAFNMSEPNAQEVMAFLAKLKASL